MKKLLLMCLCLILLSVGGYCAYYKSYEVTTTEVTTVDASADLGINYAKGGIYN